MSTINRFKIKLMKFRQRYLSRTVGPYFFTDILRHEGFNIGEGTIFYSPETQAIDRERPWMLAIGKYCKITRGCTILTHDYSRSVLRMKYGEFVGEAKLTSIGDNVFIGVNTVILMGTKIGDNVIIGAGSVVGGNIPSNVVVAGNPAKVICTLDDFYKKRKDREMQSALEYMKSYKDRYGFYPDANSNNPFFALYTSRERLSLHDNRIKCNGDDPEDILNHLKNSSPTFQSYDEFINYIDTHE